METRVSILLERALFAGLFITCLGSYFGNVFIVAGHGFLIIAMGLQLFIRRASFRSGATPSGKVDTGQSRPRWSTWFLLGIMLAILVSILANFSEIHEPIKVLKKARYHLIWAGLILTPGLRTLFFRRIESWAPWLLLAWLTSLCLATVSGMIGVITGYNPLLLAPEAYPTRVAGVSSMVMTYAYSLQFSVLLLMALSVAGKEVREWLTGGRVWLERLIYATLVLAVNGLYFSYTRGALAGAIFGGLCLLLVYQRKLLMVGVATVALMAGVLALNQGNRYVSKTALKADVVRVSQWKTAWRAFLEQPLFGVGYRQFEEKCVELKKSYGMPLDHTESIDGKKTPVHFSGHAHNEYLEALASTGLFGALAFLGFCAFWTGEVAGGRLARHFFLPVIVAFLVSGLVQNMFTDSEVLNFLLLIYFLSQMVLDWERKQDDRGKVLHPAGAAGLPPSAGGGAP